MCGGDERSRKALRSQLQQIVRLQHSVSRKMTLMLDTDRLEYMMRSHHMTLGSL